MQPIYDKSEFKIQARKENIDIYCRLTGRKSIPRSKGYWTLCNRQPDTAGSEIVQLVEAGMIRKCQFHGVDRDESIVAQNRLWHPTANWHSGDWLEVVESAKDFDPAMVYLDTTSFADHSVAAMMTVRTMMICKSGTVLVSNVMLNDPRSRKRFDPDKLVKNIERQVPAIELVKWRSSVENYFYSATGKTFMMTYVFHKP